MTSGDLELVETAVSFWISEMDSVHPDMAQEMRELLERLQSVYVPIHPRPDLAPAIVAWNSRHAVDHELEVAGYLIHLGNGDFRVTAAGREAGLK